MTTIEEFDSIAAAFMHSARHPTLDRSYLECAFLPMVELLDYLAANGFTSYIASGGGRDFMRVISQELYGIPPDRVVGSSVALEYREEGDIAQIVHTAKPDILDDGPAKPVRIWSRVGRRPILAAGNSNGDIQMLQFASHPSRASLQPARSARRSRPRVRLHRGRGGLPRAGEGAGVDGRQRQGRLGDRLRGGRDVMTRITLYVRSAPGRVTAQMTQTASAISRIDQNG